MTLLNNMFVRFIQMVACSNSLRIPVAERTPLYTHLSTHSTVDGHLGCLVIMHEAYYDSSSYMSFDEHIY